MNETIETLTAERDALRAEVAHLNREMRLAGDLICQGVPSQAVKVLNAAVFGGEKE